MKTDYLCQFFTHRGEECTEACRPFGDDLWKVLNGGFMSHTDKIAKDVENGILNFLDPIMIARNVYLCLRTSVEDPEWQDRYGKLADRCQKVLEDTLKEEGILK